MDTLTYLPDDHLPDLTERSLLPLPDDGMIPDIGDDDGWIPDIDDLPDDDLPGDSEPTTPARGCKLRPSGRLSAASQALALPEVAGLELVHDSQGRAYAVQRTPERGQRLLPLDGPENRRIIQGSYYRAYGSAIGSEGLSQVLGVLDCQAYMGPQITPWLRVAVHEGIIWLDLADDQGQAVRVTPAGYEVTRDLPAGLYFLRPAGMEALPVPEPGGSLQELWELLPQVREADRILVETAMLAWLRPDIPQSVLCLEGPQGCGKTLLARVLLSLLDPGSPLTGLPRDPRDLAVAVMHIWLYGVDNVDGVRGEISDLICCLTSGGAYRTRTLYSDSALTVMSYLRPVIMTGIAGIATRPDLMDRSLVLRLEPLGPARASERELWARWLQIRPRVLGALLSAASVGLGEVTV